MSDLARIIRARRLEDRVAIVDGQPLIDSHLYADAWPLMPPHRFASLVDSIKTSGQRQACVHHDGVIVDGRNRYLACLVAKVEPKLRAFGSDPSDGDDLCRFVIDSRERADLDDGQRGLCARRMEAANRQLTFTGIDPDDAEKASAVLDDGVPELVAAVDAGDVQLGVAAEIAKLDEDEQREAVKRLTEEPEAEAPRARRDAAVMSKAVELSPVEIVQLQVACQLLAKSPHPEARGAVAVIKRMVVL